MRTKCRRCWSRSSCASELRRARQRTASIRGEIVLVPAANPIGLAQVITARPSGASTWHRHQFQPRLPHVADELKERPAGKLGADAAANVP
jgi:hypothetical protein